MMRDRRRLVVGGIAGLVVAVIVFAWYGVEFGGPPGAASGPSGPRATAEVTRTTLVETVKVSGTLGYGGATTLAGRGTGTITWLPAPGAVVERGQAVYRVDEKPVPLLYGPLPMYRVLASGVTGPDVRQLEENLVALGYEGLTVDDSFTGETYKAVVAWQADLGVPQTGRVTPADVVIASGPMRISALATTLGSPAAGPVLSYTDTTRVVSIDLDVSRQHLVAPGVSAVVTLPNGTTVDGEVASVGTVARTTSTGGPGGGTTTTVEVTVAVADQAVLGALDAAPVTVTLEAARAEDVLTVPIAALLALAEGGYGVEVIEGSTSRYVAVSVGMFAGGRVEISAEGIVEGTVVGMPAS
ncbi:MAG: peptidoglycan-binding protein [Micromonosporaceae bacterium]|nr:peptidoglycan-binding protein [Micromonosporaceae bacterium]